MSDIISDHDVLVRIIPSILINGFSAKYRIAFIPLDFRIDAVRVSNIVVCRATELHFLLCFVNESRLPRNRSLNAVRRFHVRRWRIEEPCALVRRCRLGERLCVVLRIAKLQIQCSHVYNNQYRLNYNPIQI